MSEPTSPAFPGRGSACCATGFTDTVCIADCPDADSAQHSVILARGPRAPAAEVRRPEAAEAPQTWLLFADAGAADRPSAAAELARRLEERGDGVIRVTHGTDFDRAEPAVSASAAATPTT